jgi:hypothetical protein
MLTKQQVKDFYQRLKHADKKKYDDLAKKDQKKATNMLIELFLL